MDEDSGRGGPRAVFFSRNQDTGTSGSRDPQSGSHHSEDCETDAVLDHFLGDLHENLGFVLRALGGW